MKCSVFCYRNSDKQGSAIPSGSLREQKSPQYLRVFCWGSFIQACLSMNEQQQKQEHEMFYFVLSEFG